MIYLQTITTYKAVYFVKLPSPPYVIHLTIVKRNYFTTLFLINLKLELLTQFPASNDEKYLKFDKWTPPNNNYLNKLASTTTYSVWNLFKHEYVRA